MTDWEAYCQINGPGPHPCERCEAPMGPFDCYDCGHVVTCGCNAEDDDGSNIEYIERMAERRQMGLVAF